MIENDFSPDLQNVAVRICILLKDASSGQRRQFGWGGTFGSRFGTRNGQQVHHSPGFWQKLGKSPEKIKFFLLREAE
ncbi:MAG TPA: hypothetical protein ENJ23_05330 [Bacteroidetes bacterium]|nr:hypothetical protein [Bacteroidota bacterium]